MSNPDAQDIDWGSIVFAYGHLFAKQARLLGTEVPLSHAKVESQELAQIILVANWIELAQAGSISISVTSSKLLFISTFAAGVKKLKDVPGGDMTRALLGQLTGHADKDTVKGIVYRMIGSDYADPYGVVVGWARKDLLQRGFYQAEQRGAIAQMIAGSKLVPLPAALGTVAPLAQTIQSALKQFQNTNPDLYKQVMGDTIGALRSRVERDTSDDN
jgi:hypothetical protein